MSDPDPGPPLEMSDPDLAPNFFVVSDSVFFRVSDTDPGLIFLIVSDPDAGPPFLEMSDPDLTPLFLGVSDSVFF